MNTAKWFDFCNYDDCRGESNGYGSGDGDGYGDGYGSFDVDNSRGYGYGDSDGSGGDDKKGYGDCGEYPGSYFDGEQTDE